MTCIVSPSKYPTKKAFRDAAMTNSDRVLIEDPSVIAPYYGNLTQYMQSHKSCTVTNHPRRSWYAAVKLDAKGQMKIS